MQETVEQEQFIENPFPAKAQSRSNTKPLTEEKMKMFVGVILAEQQGQQICSLEELKGDFGSDIIMKRIEVMKLPISFTPNGLLSLVTMCSSPGDVVTMLVDCLTQYEGKEITQTHIVDLYPWGFYNDEVHTDYVDNYLKPGKVKWGYIYGNL